MIIGISGKIGSGKDATAHIIQELTKNSYNQSPWQVKKFADKLKERIALTWNIDRKLLEDQAFKNEQVPALEITWRKLMQLEGEKMREIDIDYWIKALFSGYSPAKNWIVTDVRYPNEAEIIKAEGGILLRVNRKWHAPIKNENGTTAHIVRFPLMEGNAHLSETALDGYTGFDHIIENHEMNIDDLVEKVRKLNLV